MILLSTQHRDIIISDNASKPEIILDYNATKGAVDAFDRILASYSCQRGTKRRPLVVFYNLINISWSNAFVIYLKQNPSYNKNIIHKRRLFIYILYYLNFYM